MQRQIKKQEPLGDAAALGLEADDVLEAPADAGGEQEDPADAGPAEEAGVATTPSAEAEPPLQSAEEEQGVSAETKPLAEEKAAPALDGQPLPMAASSGLGPEASASSFSFENSPQRRSSLGLPEPQGMTPKASPDRKVRTMYRMKNLSQKKKKSKLGRAARKPPPENKSKSSKGKTGRFRMYTSAQDSEEMLKLGIKIGPMTLAEMQQWPTRNADILAAVPGAFDRVQYLIRNGLIFHSDFSGQMCGETGARMQIRGFRKRGMQCSEDDLVVWAVTEIGKTQLSLLKAASKTRRGPTHVFEDVMVHVQPGKPVTDIYSFRPPQYKSKPANSAEKKARLEQARAAYSKQFLYIAKHRRQLFARGRLGKCLCHKRACEVAWQTPAALSEGGRRPVDWSMSGPDCTPFTPYGKRSLGAHPATEAWNVFSVKTAMSEHDVVTMENSDLMPPLFDEIMATATADEQVERSTKWFVVTIFANTTDEGWAGRRRRSWRTGVNTDTMLWLGPRTRREQQDSWLYIH